MAIGVQPSGSGAYGGLGLQNSEMQAQSGQQQYSQQFPSYQTGSLGFTSGSNQTSSPSTDITSAEDADVGSASQASGGADMISSIIQSGVNTGALIGEWMAGTKEMKLLKQQRREDLARYRKEYDDMMRQQMKNNMFQQQALDLQKGQFDWGRKTWGKQFAMSKRQYEDSRNDFREQMRRQGFDRVMKNMSQLSAENRQRQMDILNRAGV